MDILFKLLGWGVYGVLAAIALFLIPSGEELSKAESAPSLVDKGRKAESKKRLLDWQTAVTIPWGILLMFGGGLAIAKAFRSTELSTVIGQQLAQVQDWPLLALIGVVCLAITFMTEVTSNMATASVLLPRSEEHTSELQSH